MGVATAIAIGGLAVSAASTTGSFIQAGKQKKAQRAAEAKAAEAMAEARKKLEINYAEELSIKKEPYELEREAMLAQGALSVQQGAESDRGAEATAGRVQMAMNEGQAGIRTAMGQELMGIEQQIINEDSRLRDINVQLDLGEIEGAQLAARDAQEARAAAMTQGFEGLSNTMQQGLAMVPLYQKTGAPPAAPQSVPPSVGGQNKTGYSVFDDKFKPNPIGFGKSAFQNDPFAAVSFPQSIGYQPTKKYF